MKLRGGKVAIACGFVLVMGLAGVLFCQLYLGQDWVLPGVAWLGWFELWCLDIAAWKERGRLARTPEVGAIMECDISTRRRMEVEVLAVDECSVRYRKPDGQVMTRCKRGFMKHYLRRL